MPRHFLLTSCAVLLHGAALASAAEDKPDAAYVKAHFIKQEHQVPMRDGVKLFTVIYLPKDQSQKYPVIMTRTPYSVAPYGDKMREALGPNKHFLREGYIFVYQDVRGAYMSEGEFSNMRPHLAVKKSSKDVDESTDTYDAIDWLLKNVANHNGRVGLWGISYPGFYAAAGMIDAHPALRAVSPQAPIADWWYDDFHHHGAFFLPHAFNFMARFGHPRPEPTRERKSRFDHHTPDGYAFFLDLGPLKNADLRHFKGKVAFWNEMMDHPNYDEFWQSRNLLPHLKKVAPAVLTVGGWFDAEDLYGPLKIYRKVEQENPGIFNVLVMGPWEHGGWSRLKGDRLGNIHFGANTSEFFQKEIELRFFNHFLKDKGDRDLPEAYVFETGVNQWRKHDAWPPKTTVSKRLFFRAAGKLSFELPSEENAADEYVSDPSRPVPFAEPISVNMVTSYMTDDQRFASRRPDVLVYQTDPLGEDLTLAGPMLADLRVATSGTDSDWIVKVIDVFPNDAKDFPEMRPGQKLGGYQMMVRSEIIRGRFRNSHEKPEAFAPNKPAAVKLELLDVLHTFKKGHRVMVQVQSTWFPMVDRNPQTFVPNIYKADDKDFVKATQKVFRSRELPTSLRVGVLP